MISPAGRSKAQAALLSFSEELQKSGDLSDGWNLVRQYAQRLFSAQISLHTAEETEGLEHTFDQSMLKLHTLVENSKSSMLTYDGETRLYQVGAPLAAPDGLLGSLVLSRPENDFETQEIETIDDFASLVALSLTATQLEARQDYQQQQIDLIAQVTGQIAQATSLDELSREVTRLIQSSFNYYYVALFTVDAAGENLDFKASSSVNPAAQQIFKDKITGHRIPLGTHITGTVAKTGRYILANDVSQDPRFVAHESLPETQSEMALPLKLGREVLGVLDIESDRRNAFTKNDLAVMNTLAHIIAFAIQRLRLYRSLEDSNEQLQAIAQVSHSINSRLDLDQLLQHVTTMLHEEFDFPYVHIFLINYVPNQIEFRAGSGARAEAYRRRNISYDLNARPGIIPETACSGKMQRLDDLSLAENFQPDPVSGARQGSELTLPLGFGDQVLGVLDVQSDQPHAFDAQDIELLSTLASTVSIALRNANLYNSEKWRRRVAENLRDIALLLTENVSVASFLRVVLSKIMELLPCDVASIWLLKQGKEKHDLREEKLTLFSSRTAPGPFPPLPKLSLRPKDTWYTQALQKDSPIVYTLGTGQDPIAEQYHLGQDYSAIAAPLTTAGKQLGVLTLHHRSSGRYGLETQSICSSFAGYAAIALENENLLAEARSQAWVSTILLQLTLATQALTSLEQLSGMVLRLLLLVLEGHAGALVLAEQEGTGFNLYPLAANAKNNGSDPQAKPLRSSPTLLKALASRRIKAMPSGSFDRKLTSALGTKPKDTLLIVPLLAHDEPIGFLVHAGKTPYTDLEPEQVLGPQRYAILSGFAQQVALSVQNIHLLEDRQEESYVSNLLLQTSRMLFASADLDPALKQISQTLLLAGGFKRVAILAASPEGRHYTLRSLNTKDLRPNQEARLVGTIIPAEKMQVKKLLQDAPIQTKPEQWFNKLGLLGKTLPEDETTRPSKALGPKTEVLILPLVVKDTQYGLLLAQPATPKKTNRRGELLRGIAQQISYAIQNEKLQDVQRHQEVTEKEFQMARQIQRTFLPEQLPSLPGYQLDAIWHTARQVGGDFYDVFRLGEQQVGLVIADVSDKGFPAALYMTVTRTLIRATALENRSTARTLEKVNQLLQLDSQGGFFVTLFYAILDLRSGKTRYTVAGHNPPILLRPDQSAEMLPRGGIALGVMENISLPERELHLEHGASLVLYTDGITEAINRRGAFYGNTRFLKVLEKNADRHPTQLISATLADLDAFRNGEPFTDDITQLVLRRL